MKPEELHINQWQRILVGEVPPSFYIELGIRATVIYLLLMIAMRLMGKRMSSQLGRNELAAMVSLAAAIGVPLQAPDRGLLPAIVIAIVVVFTERWIASKAYKSQKFEKFSQGNIDLLVKDAVIDFQTMKKVRITRERLLARLRASGIKQLGKVERLYMEANGSFTLIEQKEIQPGLSIIPAWDENYHQRFKKTDILVCLTCGYPQKNSCDHSVICPNCNDRIWTNAVI